ncbi:TetR/AcrR family transcriptional regulator [Cellulomonas sp. WB94]|uniref:TetR/AcrR family transcriptional regulator n=1 Tax=Cellulomonas sp. WB94 TaxID=2173174 RepID=UPI001304D3F5|nr:TetR/AcrR family transcriptional regulator [Cellulomonas sp. WB94]
MHNQGVDERVLRTVWGAAPSTARGPRARYDLASIATTAVALADDRGLSGVALSALARELGLATTALYRYVDSKETLVHLMVDAAIGPPPEAAPGDWRDGIQAWVGGLWGRYRAHPWLAEVQVAGMPLYPQRLGWMEALLCELDRGQVRDPMRIALLLDGVTRSFALLARPADDAAPPSWVVEAAAARYPRLAHELARDWTDIEGELATAVRTVLAGAQRVTAGSCADELADTPGGVRRRSSR